MKTIVLPGYSERNKEWADEVADFLGGKGIDCYTHYWSHWKNGGSLATKKEIKKILKILEDGNVNIIAKSAGVMVAMNLVPEIEGRVNKIIFCGIASVAKEERKDLLRGVLDAVPVENILCIQNENDKYVTYSEALKFYNSVEPGLKVISKPRSDHNYPFFEDFLEFLA